MRIVKACPYCQTLMEGDFSPVSLSTCWRCLEPLMVLTDGAIRKMTLNERALFSNLIEKNRTATMRHQEEHFRNLPCAGRVV